MYRLTLTDMRTFESQSNEYKHYHEAREAFNNFCSRAGLEATTDDAAGGIEYKFHIQITKLNIEHENNETNFYHSFDNDNNRNSGAEIYRYLAKW